MAQIMPKFHLAFGVAEPCARLGEHRSPPGPYFSMKKSSKSIFRSRLWSPSGGALILQGAKPVRLAAGAFLLCVQKEPKYGQGGPGFPLDKPP